MIGALDEGKRCDKRSPRLNECMLCARLCIFHGSFLDRLLLRSKKLTHARYTAIFVDGESTRPVGDRPKEVVGRGKVDEGEKVEGGKVDKEKEEEEE